MAPDSVSNDRAIEVIHGLGFFTEDARRIVEALAGAGLQITDQAALRAFRDELTSQYGMRYEGSWLVGRLDEILKGEGRTRLEMPPAVPAYPNEKDGLF